jgi:hypothetical protein
MVWHRDYYMQKRYPPSNCDLTHIEAILDALRFRPNLLIKIYSSIEAITNRMLILLHLWIDLVNTHLTRRGNYLFYHIREVIKEMNFKKG